MTPGQEVAIRADLDHPDNRDPSCQSCHLHVLLREVDTLRKWSAAWRSAARLHRAAEVRLLVHLAKDSELWSLAGQRIEHLEWQTSELIEQLAAVTAERDALQREVHDLQRKLTDYPPVNATQPQPTCRTCGERTCCEGHDCSPEASDGH